MEDQERIPFLDVLIKRNARDEIETSVYRKATNTDIYMNWYSHAPSSWKIATLKSLVKRAFLVSSNTESLNCELDHIKTTLSDKNDYPPKLIEEIVKNERNYHQQQLQQAVTSVETDEENAEEEKPASLTLNLPYAGDKGEKLISKVKKYESNTVNKSKKIISVSTIYKATRLGSKFNIKDQIKLEHQHNVVYHTECPNRKCKSHYTGQTKCRVGKRASQHNGKDKKSHLFKHAQETKHKRVKVNDFNIIGKGYRSDFTRRISESLLIKKLKPDLNIQKDSYKLSLFN